MNNAINYIGEHTITQQLGYFFVYASFVSSLLSIVGYYFASQSLNEINSWKKFANTFFTVHSISVIGIVGVLFYVLLNHYYEFAYVWQHSNNSMPLQYILSCFWEGQEGSFLLWIVWNVILANVFRKVTSDKWKSISMLVFSLVQLFLTSMLLGIYFNNYKIGSSPFLFLREHSDFSNLPFVQQANYVVKLDGRGLNPLLMNYWMTIHPPILFLGFSSTIIPFAFAITALWKKEFTAWQKPALPWTLFSVAILGLGILMGGAWAYEALSFNGFWAWDPVENSSLVPWIVILAASHVMIINRKTNKALFLTLFLCIASFLLVLYSTFLTRSGILGNSSVHAFTDLGMQGQLLLYMLFFVFLYTFLLLQNKLWRVSYIFLSILLLIANTTYTQSSVLLMLWFLITLFTIIYAYNAYFNTKNESENIYSREFWMFIGAITLLISAFTLTYFTSIPVINKLFNLNKAPLQISDYNNWMMPYAVVILILVGVTQYMKFKLTDLNQFLKQNKWSFLLSVLFSVVCIIPLYFLNNLSLLNNEWLYIMYSIVFFAALYAVFSNLDYWIRVLSGKIGHAGAAIAHVGFALIILGALVSTSKRQTLSVNTSQVKVENLGESFSSQKSLLLTQGDTLPIGNYWITYQKKHRQGVDVFFTMVYFKKIQKQFIKVFELTPTIQDNPKMGRAASPDTKHFLSHDVYTHISYADLSDNSSIDNDAYLPPSNFIGHVQDTIQTSHASVLISQIKTNINKKQYQQNDSLLIVSLVLNITSHDKKTYQAFPKYIINKSIVSTEPAEVPELGLRFTFWKINPTDGTVELQVSEKQRNKKDFVVMEAYMFPFINLLWLGSLLMVLGTIIAVITRVRKNKKASH